MQTELARAEQERLMEVIDLRLGYENASVILVLYIKYLNKLLTQALDALDSAKAIWRLANDGVETVEMENLK